MIDNFVLLMVSEWEKCIELRFVQDEAAPHVALTTFVWLKNHFSNCWVGH